MDVDENEKFYFRDNLFTDPDGPLKLSAKQMKIFGEWKRPSQLSSNPKVVTSLLANNITQVYNNKLFSYSYRM